MFQSFSWPFVVKICANILFRTSIVVATTYITKSQTFASICSSDLEKTFRWEKNYRKAFKMVSILLTHSVYQMYVYTSVKVKWFQIWIFWVFVNLYGSRNMHNYGICQVCILGWVTKFCDLTEQSRRCLRKYKYLMKEVYWQNVDFGLGVGKCHLLFCFQKFVYGFQMGPKLGLIWDFRKLFKTVFWHRL